MCRFLLLHPLENISGGQIVERVRITVFLEIDPEHLELKPGVLKGDEVTA